MSSIKVEKELTLEPAAVCTWLDGRMVYVELTDNRIPGRQI